VNVVSLSTAGPVCDEFAASGLRTLARVEQGRNFVGFWRLVTYNGRVRQTDRIA